MKNYSSKALTLVILLSFSFLVKAQYVARHNMSSSGYQTEFNKWVSTNKMRLADVSVYNRNGQATYAALWDNVKDNDWKARHDMSPADYQTEVNNRKKENYRPQRISVANVGGKLIFACIFHKSNYAWEARHDMTSQQYQNECDNWITKKGYRLIDVCGYNKNGQETYAAVWEKSPGPAFIARHAMSSQKFQSEFDTQYGNGYKPVRVSGFGINGNAVYAAIWEKMTPGVYTRFGLTEYNYQAEIDNNWYTGSALKQVCGYNVDGKVYFTGLWMGLGLSDNDQDFIDKKVKKYMNDFNVPGLSIAVMKDERLVYAKGYGMADKGNGDIVSPNSLFRIASVSKPITAAAIMRLTETTDLKLSDKLFGSNGILGDYCATNGSCVDKADAEKITVQSCLEHTTGWTQDAVWDQYQLNNNEIIKWALKNYSQGTEPGKKYTYINFDYFLLGRVIEKKSGKTYENYVKSEILGKCGITDMRTGNDAASGKFPNEVTYYGNDSPYSLKLTRMDANGGWIARPIDLLMFFAGMDSAKARKDFMDKNSFHTMHIRSTGAGAGTYAKGLLVDVNYWMHNGCMPGTLGHLCHFSNGITVAVLINIRPTNDECHWDGMYPMAKSIAEGSINWPSYNLF